MKTLFIIPLVLMSLVSSPSWALSMNDLVGNDADGLAYQKFTSTPFTGKLNRGLQRGSFKNGKREGYWEEYRETGLLFKKGTYKNGKKEGYWEEYHENGQLSSKGDYKNGKKEGYWEEYYLDSFSIDLSADFLGMKGVDKLMTSKGDYKNGKKEGYWESYKLDGTVWKDFNGTYKNGVKVSD